MQRDLKAQETAELQEENEKLRKELETMKENARMWRDRALRDAQG